jgi:hypothetical protein
VRKLLTTQPKKQFKLILDQGVFPQRGNYYFTKETNMKNKKAILPAVCVLAAVLAAGVIACGGGGGSSRPRPASEFAYELNKAGDGVVITDYIGKTGGVLVIPSQIEGLPVVEFRAGALSGFHEPFYRIFLNAAEKAKKKDAIKEYRAKIKKEKTRESFTAVVFPDTITEMASTTYGSSGEQYATNGAFEGSFALKSVKFPKKIREIPSMFSSCDALTEITLPESVEIIGKDAFFGLNITKLVLPEGVKEIRYQAFRNCKKLQSVKFPSTIESIGEYAFENCESLTTVEIPEKQIKYPGYDPQHQRAFAFCPQLNLTVRKKIQDTGYKSTFGDPFAE